MPYKRAKVKIQAAVKEKHYKYLQLSKFFVVVSLQSVRYHSLCAIKIYWQ